MAMISICLRNLNFAKDCIFAKENVDLYKLTQHAYRFRNPWLIIWINKKNIYSTKNFPRGVPNLAKIQLDCFYNIIPSLKDPEPWILEKKIFCMKFTLHFVHSFSCLQSTNFFYFCNSFHEDRQTNADHPNSERPLCLLRFLFTKSFSYDAWKNESQVTKLDDID